MTAPDPLDDLEQALLRVREEIDRGLELVARAIADRAEDDASD